MIIELLILVLAGAAAVTLSSVLDSLRSHKVNFDDVAELIQASLDGRRIKLLGQVFSAGSPVAHHQESWIVDSLDESLRQQFNGTNRIRVSL